MINTKKVLVDVEKHIHDEWEKLLNKKYPPSSYKITKFRSLLLNEAIERDIKVLRDDIQSKNK